MNRKIFPIFLLFIFSICFLIFSCNSGSDDSGSQNPDPNNTNNLNADTDCIYVGAFESVLALLEINDLTLNTPEDLTINEVEVGVLEEASDVEGIVYDFTENGSFPDPGRLLAADNEALLEVSTSNAETIMVDAFGTVEIPGPITDTIDNVDGLAFDPNENLFYGSQRDIDLDYIFTFTLDDTGNDTKIDNVELLSVMPGDILCGSDICVDIDDLAYDFVGNRLLAVINRDDVINLLVEVDTTDGSMEVVGTIFLDDCVTPLEDIEGLGITLNGRIFATTGLFGNMPNGFFELEIDDSTVPVKVCATRLLDLSNLDAESLDCSVDTSLQ